MFETKMQIARTTVAEYPWVRCPSQYDASAITAEDVQHDAMIEALDQDSLGRPIVARAWIAGPAELILVIDGGSYRWLQAADEADTEVSAPSEAEALAAAEAAWQGWDLVGR